MLHTFVVNFYWEHQSKSCFVSCRRYKCLILNLLKLVRQQLSQFIVKFKLRRYLCLTTTTETSINAINLSKTCSTITNRVNLPIKIYLSLVHFLIKCLGRKHALNDYNIIIPINLSTLKGLELLEIGIYE